MLIVSLSLSLSLFSSHSEFPSTSGPLELSAVIAHGDTNSYSLLLVAADYSFSYVLVRICFFSLPLLFVCHFSPPFFFFFF
jgi:hypothetical protein